MVTAGAMAMSAVLLQGLRLLLLAGEFFFPLRLFSYSLYCFDLNISSSVERLASPEPVVAGKVAHQQRIASIA